MNRYNHNSLLVRSQGQQPAPYGLGGHGSQMPGDTGDDGRIDLTSIWDTIKRGKWIILATCVVVTAVITLYTLTLDPVYRASSIVSVDTRNDLPPSVMMTNSGYDITAEIGELSYSAELKQRVARQMKEIAATTEAQFPILQSEEGEITVQEVAGRLGGRMEFLPVETRNMIQINANSGMPEEAALIANLYAEEFRRYRRETSQASIRAQRQFLEDQIDKQEETLADLESQWESFARSNDVVTQGAGGEGLVGQYRVVLEQRNNTEFALDQERARLDRLRRQLASVSSDDVRSDVGREQEVARINGELQTINTQLTDLTQRASVFYQQNPNLEGDAQRIRDEFPRLQEINDNIVRLRDRRNELTDELADLSVEQSSTVGEGGAVGFASQIRAQIAETEAAIATSEGQLADLNRRLAGFEGQLGSIPRQQVQRAALERKLELQRQFNNTFLQELQRVRMQEEAELGYINVVQNARTPANPVSPDLQQNILLGLLLGLGLGTGLAFVRQAAASQFHRPEDIQDAGYSLVGVIPRMDREIKAAFEGKETVQVDDRAVSTRLMPMHNPWSPISENYRLVRTNLQYASGDGAAPQVLLLTSPEPADGKTLTAINLAITVAQSGRHTLVIDADLRRPAAHKLFDLPNEHGLADVLRDDHAPRRHTIATEVENLFFLPAGKTEFPPAEMLGSERMQRTLDALRGEYDTIIVDSPPVLAVSDPVLLATRCDATLVVVSADRTDSRALNVTRQTLEAVGVSISGVIFNRFDAQRAGGYGYGYRYDYDEYTTGVTRRR